MCRELTDSSIKFIAELCPGLCSLDLTNLCKLTDSSIGYLANGCRELHILKLLRNPFRFSSLSSVPSVSLLIYLMLYHNVIISSKIRIN